MKQPTQQIDIRPTMAGMLSIRSNCTPESIRELDFDTYFGVNARPQSILTSRKALEARAAEADTNVVLAVTEKDQIAGFGFVAPPDAGDHWAQMTPGVVTEIAVVEVHHNFRACRIAGDMIRQMLAHPHIEKMIAFMVGYSWTWDLAGTGLDGEAYRELLIRLFSRYGFSQYMTNEPNICLKPENLFMARIGSGVSDELCEEFMYLRYGVPTVWR